MCSIVDSRIVYDTIRIQGVRRHGFRRTRIRWVYATASAVVSRHFKYDFLLENHEANELLTNFMAEVVKIQGDRTSPGIVAPSLKLLRGRLELSGKGLDLLL
jgi:hypothetical protein